MNNDEKYTAAVNAATAVLKKWKLFEKTNPGTELPDEVLIASALINADKTYGCELRDPNGTIWQYAAALRDELRAVLSEGLTEERCSNIRRLVSD